MDDPRATADAATEKRLQIQRRAKRGLVAGYIHSLSARHGRGTAVARAGAPERGPATSG